jgi:hypothetical protein
MRYLLSVLDSGPAAVERALLADLLARGALVCSGTLAPATAATTVRAGEGKRTIDPRPLSRGPAVAAFLVVDCADLDEAIAVAERCGRTVEIRPVEPGQTAVDSAAPRSSA